MSSLAISVENLTRRFGNFTAVASVSFTIKYGEIFGFLGPNGAGKSTTIRMLCGILAPSGGTASVGGASVNREPERVKESIGYVSQNFSLYNDLTVRENLEFYGRVYCLGRRALNERVDAVFDFTGLGQFEKRLAGELSGGWKQRLAVGNAILHRPKILFLDEPTAGVDPLSRRALWELLYQLADEGVALFVTTHYMEEAERCNQIAFISEGKILRIGEPEVLKAEVTGKLLEVECKPLMKASRIFRALPGVIGLTAYGTSLHLNVTDPEQAASGVHRAAKEAAIEVKSIRPIPASLEDVFATLEEDADGAH